MLNTKYYSYYHDEEKSAADQRDKAQTSELIGSLEDQLEKLKARTYVAEQINKHKEELGMAGRSLSLRSSKDKDGLGKIGQSVEEVRKYSP